MRGGSSVGPAGLPLGVFCGSAFGTMLNRDAAGLVGGSQPFAGTAWLADVEYAVYAPTNSPGSHPDKNDKYVHAYRVFSSSSSSSTSASLTTDLLTGCGAASPGDDSTYGAAGGGAPPLSRLAGSAAASMQWVLDMDGGGNSTVLPFRSLNNYTFESATVTNGGAGDTQSLPTPLSEPATLSLLALGRFALVRHRRQGGNRPPVPVRDRSSCCKGAVRTAQGPA